MARNDGVTALRRFGLGVRPRDLERIGGDPRGFLIRALDHPGEALVASQSLVASHEAYRRFLDARMADRAGRQKAVPAPVMTDSAGSQKPVRDAGNGSTMRAAVRREIWQAEVEARFAHAVKTDNGFVERLVQFWSNHFAISAGKSGPVRVMSGGFEREAIRPHVLGRFADMLRAVEQHPAMLIYLDNDKSFGPNSRTGKKRGRGLNENLAREILELHTVGVGAGYTQEDVTNLARIITGWGVAGVRQQRFEAGRFAFFRPRHEPGDWSVLGRRYPDRGVATGEAVLADLSRHPATARHIAGKLARHFTGDAASPSLVARLEKTFLDTGGQLGEVSRALVTSDEAWAARSTKILPPYDFLVAMMRGLDVDIPPMRAARLSAALGQPIWNPPSPKGWPDDDEAWMGPSAVRERLRVAELFAARAARNGDPRSVARSLFQDGLLPAEYEAIRRAETKSQGFELLIMSASFQRR
ncbi:MAG: hypothetical protein RLZ98_2443 [Pseudomonadota bacterium]|jgi:uncharacterized protein (DUF1800 family)